MKERVLVTVIFRSRIFTDLIKIKSAEDKYICTSSEWGKHRMVWYEGGLPLSPPPHAPPRERTEPRWRPLPRERKENTDYQLSRQIECVKQT